MGPARASTDGHSSRIPGAIQIETAKARVCVQGVADLSCVRLVLEYLLG